MLPERAGKVKPESRRRGREFSTWAPGSRRADGRGCSGPWHRLPRHVGECPLLSNAPVPEVFVNARGEALTCSGFTYIVKKYAHVAMPTSPGPSDKSVSPHVLRHTCAMNSLQATRDIRKVALWLGHSNLKSTEIYLRADPTEKLNAIESALPPNLRGGVFHVEDRLIAWLSGTTISGVDPRPEPVATTLSAPDS